MNTKLIAGIAVVVLGGFLLMQQRGAGPELSPESGQVGLPIRGISDGDEAVIDESQREFAQCLVDAGMVVYASYTCPACSDFAQDLGGYDIAPGLFVECSEQPMECQNNMQTNFVPEIQINGELHDGDRDLVSLAEKTGCEI